MKSLRKSRHITKKNLAKNAGVHLETLTRVLNNQGSVSNYFKVLKSLDGVIYSSTFNLTDDIGNDLKHIRKKANISQDRLSKLIKVTQKTVSDLENVKGKNFKVNTLFNYIDACGHKVQILPSEQKASYIKMLTTSKETVYFTPSFILQAITNTFGKIDLDPCAETNTDCHTGALSSYTVADDGLSKIWHGITYCNPPYGVNRNNMDLWLIKGFKHYREGDTDACVMLIPFRPEMDYFKRLIIDTKATIFVLQGRGKFNGMKGTAPFPLVVVVWSNVAYDKDKFSKDLNSWYKDF